MRGMCLIGVGLTLAMVAGCGHMANRVPAQSTLAPLRHFYDYQLIRSADQQPITLPHLVQELAPSDVIFIGEVHTHSASHLLQMQLLATLYQHRPQLMLSMEQFERDQQEVVNQYLENKIGEQTLIAQSHAWPNYESDYRPLVEFAKAHQIPVIAANAPKSLVRCIALRGPAFVDQLPEQQRAYLAADLTQASAAYQARFRQFMSGEGAFHQSPQKGQEANATPHAAAPHHHPGGAHGAQTAQLSNSFYAQLARDNTMAESIAKALDAQPDHQVIAINGAFHSDGGLGTVESLKRLRPDLQIRVLSPYERKAEASDLATAAGQGDYLYAIQPMPERYRQKEHRDRAIMATMKKRQARACDW